MGAKGLAGRLHRAERNLYGKAEDAVAILLPTGAEGMHRAYLQGSGGGEWRRMDGEELEAFKAGWSGAGIEIVPVARAWRDRGDSARVSVEAGARGDGAEERRLPGVADGAKAPEEPGAPEVPRKGVWPVFL